MKSAKIALFDIAPIVTFFFGEVEGAEDNEARVVSSAWLPEL